MRGESTYAAQEKNGLFALVVTPNLVNELNYVMSTEYPAAHEASKPVLPIEAAETKAAQSFDDTAVSCYMLWSIDLDNRALLERACGIYEMLCEQCPDVQRYVHNRNVMQKLLGR